MIDIERIISKHLISQNIANGNVVILNQAVEYKPPAVLVQLTSLNGNVNEGFYQANVYLTCTTNNEYDTLKLADEVRHKMDGYGDGDIEHIEFTNMVMHPDTSVNTSIHSAVLMFNIIYLEE